MAQQDKLLTGISSICKLQACASKARVHWMSKQDSKITSKVLLQ